MRLIQFQSGVHEWDFKVSVDGDTITAHAARFRFAGEECELVEDYSFTLPPVTGPMRVEACIAQEVETGKIVLFVDDIDEDAGQPSFVFGPEYRRLFPLFDVHFTAGQSWDSADGRVWMCAPPPEKLRLVAKVNDGGSDG